MKLTKIAVFFFTLIAQGAVAVETVELEVAQSYVFTTPEDATLKISKKGVVDVFAISPGRWRVTALRRGLISIRWLGAQEEVLGRIYIHVSSFNAKSVDNFPRWVCKKKQVSCDARVGVIRGVIDDEYSWVKAFNECQKSLKCFFQLKLTTEAKSRLEVYEASQSERYVVRTHIVLANKKDAEKFGITARYMKSNPNFFDFDINDEDQKQKFTLLGEPSVVCQLGKKAIIRSGGEVESFYQRSDKRSPLVSYWKKYGMLLESKLSRITQNLYKVDARIELSRRSNGGLQSHELTTSIPIMLEKRVMLGVVEFQSDESKVLTPFHLDQVPIIGPWFSFRTSDRVSSLLIIFLHVERWSGLQLKSQE